MLLIDSLTSGKQIEQQSEPGESCTTKTFSVPVAVADIKKLWYYVKKLFHYLDTDDFY